MTHNLEDYTFDQDSNGDYVVTYDPTGTVIERIDSGNEEKILEVATQISTLKDATSGNQVYDSPSEELTADVNNDSVSTDDRDSTEQATQDQTVTQAINNLPSSGGEIRIRPNYPSNDTLPITIDRVITAKGAGQESTETTLDFAGDTANNILEVNYATDPAGNAIDASQSLTLKDLRLIGGFAGVLFENIQYVTVRDVTVDAPDQYGFWITDTGDNQYGFTFDRAKVFNSGGDGFKIEPDDGTGNLAANATTFRDCVAQWNAGKGIFQPATAGSNIIVDGGVWQFNDSYAFDFRGNGPNVITNAWIESNDTADNFDVNMASSGMIVGNNLHGDTGQSHAIQASGSNIYIDGNRYGNYTNGFLNINGTDVNIGPNNYASDGTPLINQDTGTRTRYMGVIGGGPLGGVDLSTTTGQFVGDRAIANGSSAAPAGALARWDGSVWQYHSPTGTV